MENLKIALLLHFYQPYWQSPVVLQKIIEECYKPILRFVNSSRVKFAFSANINYSLLELLSKFGHEDVIKDFKTATGNCRLELLGTAAYHPILPLLPQREIKKQIIYDSFMKKARFQICNNSRGFFFPEMAFSENVIPVLEKRGFNWAVIEETAVPRERIPYNQIFRKNNFFIFLRSHHWSKYVWNDHLDFGEFVKRLHYELPGWVGKDDCYLVLAMDAETFGHHVPGLAESFLFPIVSGWGGKKLVRFEDLLKMFPSEVESFRECSWATGEDDLQVGNPFPLWNSPTNGYHRYFWDLINLALKYAGHRDAIYPCLRIVSSCHSWWISGRPHWNPDFMKNGATGAYHVVMRFGNKVEKEDAQKLFDYLCSLR